MQPSPSAARPGIVALFLAYLSALLGISLALMLVSQAAQLCTPVQGAKAATRSLGEGCHPSLQPEGALLEMFCILLLLVTVSTSESLLG